VNAKELLRYALTMTDEGMARLVSDMREHALVQPLPTGGNHTMWNLGHLAAIEGSIAPVLNRGTNPVGHWFEMFAPGTTPRKDGRGYPSFDVLAGTLRELRAKNLKLLEEYDDDSLGHATPSPPPGFEDAMKAVGQVFLLTALHQMVHYGQIADCRRAAGKAPLM